jgi:type IV pilus assembly protein PilQ
VDGTGEITTPDDLVVDLGVTAANASSFGIGIAGADYLIDLEISALETDGHAEVVARPKVITADKQKAVIQSGTEIPYQEAASSGATSTSFKEAVLSLEVTPQITPDDRIIMDLKVNQDTVGEIFNNVPSIDTNEITTLVLVDNGQTVVLGGIFKDEKAQAIVKTPFLGDIPYLGRLFRKNLERSEKQELLIFITPRIIQESLTAR